MGSHELSPELQDRLKEALGSYEELQLLLYARRASEPWTTEDAARRLQLPDGTLGETIQALVGAGFLSEVQEGASGERRLQYQPASPGLGELADRLAEVLEQNPLHLFDLMNRHALERLRTSAARTFASAFILGRKKDG